VAAARLLLLNVVVPVPGCWLLRRPRGEGCRGIVVATTGAVPLAEAAHEREDEQEGTYRDADTRDDPSVSRRRRRRATTTGRHYQLANLIDVAATPNWLIVSVRGFILARAGCVINRPGVKPMILKSKELIAES
jgi:hypothetical protein